ncbi:MAG: hypothetical protein GYB64_17765 [Chloroflexi bacterium]|nr:hypothetical protein [Chloroflexota bacterium]
MNRSTRIVAAVLGVLFGISGLSHGFFEVRQGNTPTEGLLIDAIHPSMQMWAYGGETAFTLIPNFLFTGLAAITVSIAIIVWCVRYLDTRHGASVFLGLFVLLFLVGGGIGQIAFFVPGWAFATRINKPLTVWRRILPEGLRGPLARIWPFTAALAAVLVLIALEIAIFGFFPGFTDPDRLLTLVMVLLGSALLLFGLSFVSAFADDMNHNPLPLNPSVAR